MKVGARNKLQGKVVGIKKGTVMCQVQVEVAGAGVMESVMTIDSLEDMGVKVGDTVKLAVKAIHVLLMKD